MDIINLSRAELSALMATTVQPTCVNIPEELIRCIPLYVRNRVRFVNCHESVPRFDIDDELYQAELPMPPRVGVIDSATGCIVPPHNLASATTLVPRFDKAGRNKSQILKDMAEKLTAEGIDTVCLDFTTQGDDDDD